MSAVKEIAYIVLAAGMSYYYAVTRCLWAMAAWLVFYVVLVFIYTREK